MSESFEPEITVLYCGRSLAEGAYLPEGYRTGNGFKVRFIMMPCSSKIEVGYLVKLIEQGADGVMLVVCPRERCQFMLGSTRAKNRVNYARSLLDEVGIGAVRIGVFSGYDLSADRFIALAEEQADAVKPLGQNPMKASRTTISVGL